MGELRRYHRCSHRPDCQTPRGHQCRRRCHPYAPLVKASPPWPLALKRGFRPEFGAAIEGWKYRVSKSFSPRPGEGVAGSFGCQHEADGIEHRSAVGLCGADDGAEGGIGFRPPFAAEPVGHLAKDHAGPEMPF